MVRGTEWSPAGIYTRRYILNCSGSGSPGTGREKMKIVQTDISYSMTSFNKTRKCPVCGKKTTPVEYETKTSSIRGGGCRQCMLVFSKSMKTGQAVVYKISA